MPVSPRQYRMSKAVGYRVAEARRSVELDGIGVVEK